MSLHRMPSPKKQEVDTEELMRKELGRIKREAREKQRKFGGKSKKKSIQIKHGDLILNRNSSKQLASKNV